MKINGVKRTIWARRNRRTFDAFIGFRLPGVELARLKRIAELLNTDVSEILRAYVRGLLLIPQNNAEIGANLHEITQAENHNPPTTSDKIRYV
jgi:hypothetical protein